ncbi:hypothetical protein B0H16DRAFT_1700937 [Mycena metata]|uniref:Uncharacterized protein n=1 Tax=Mycena metata TaxID=1033252 RepID=A0AAD7HDW5_9AGAR|nr:hypothetical protein B0H16DRAFT_1700937 [Mycena metata]
MPGRISGGKGGAGGAGRTGGNGGAGQAPRMSPETAKVFDGNIDDGIGGVGGRGELQSGIDGVGERADFSLPSLYAGKLGGAAIDMPLKEFCAQYKVGEELVERLGQLGFTTVGSLLEVKDAE